MEESGWSDPHGDEARLKAPQGVEGTWGGSG